MATRFDPTDPAFIDDPYPLLTELREAGPVVRSDEWGLWLITRHADVLAAQRDRRLGRVRAGHAEPDDFRPIRELDLDVDWAPYYEVERHSLLMLEPPEHTRIRSLVSRAFTPGRVRGLRPEIERIADELLATVGERFELLAEFAQPFSIRVIATLLGAPVDDEARLLDWSHAIVKMYELDPGDDQARAAVEASAGFAGWVTDLIASRRASPRDDLITALCQAETDEGSLSDGEIVSTVILLLNAGHEATVNTMGNGLTAILRHGAWERITSGEVSPEVAIEEMLRWDPPLQLFERWVLTDDYELAGTPIPAGDKIAMLFGAANRDPRAFDRPDEFRIDRGDTSHITFGAGAHYCLGAPLARLELQIALERLTRRFPSLALVEGPRRIPAFVIRGYESVLLADGQD